MGITSLAVDSSSGIVVASVIVVAGAGSTTVGEGETVRGSVVGADVFVGVTVSASTVAVTVRVVGLDVGTEKGVEETVVVAVLDASKASSVVSPTVTVGRDDVAFATTVGPGIELVPIALVLLP